MTVSLLRGCWLGTPVHVLNRRSSNKTQYRTHVAVLGGAIVALAALITWDAILLLAPGWLKPDGTDVPALRLLITLAMSASANIELFSHLALVDILVIALQFADNLSDWTRAKCPAARC